MPASRLAVRLPPATVRTGGTLSGARHRSEPRNTTSRELLMEQYERLKQLVEAAAEDVSKATGGNKAAGTRVRKAMQDVKAAAQEVRKRILEVRSETEG